MSAPARTLGRSERRVLGGLLLLAAVPVFAGVFRLVELAGGAEVTEANARFFDSPWPVALHMLAIVPFSVLGAFQLLPGVRRRWRGWHRAAGRWLIGCGLVSAVTGLWMAHFYPWPETDGYLLYLIRLAVGVAMIAFLARAIDAIRRRDFRTHGEWMIRAYALGMGAGTQAFTHLPWMVTTGMPGGLTRALLMGAGWGINVVVAEWVIRRGRRALGSVPPVVHGAAAAGQV